GEHLARRDRHAGLDHLPQVAPGTEGFPRAGEDRHAQGGIALEPVPCGEQARAHVRAEAVAPFGAVERDDRDAVGAGLEEHGVLGGPRDGGGLLIGCAHQNPLCSIRWAARARCSRKSGWAMAVSLRARSARSCPASSAAPYSVTMTSTSLRAVVTGPDNAAVIRLTVPPFAVAGRAMTARPPGERAPARTKSTCPPVPPR